MGHEFAYYRRALEIEVAENPEDVEARVFLAKTLLEQGELQGAKEQLTVALELRPDHPDARAVLEKIKLKEAQVPFE